MPRARKRPGPAPGTGGRPRLAQDSPAASLTVRLTSADRGRLERLRSLWELDSDSATLRRVLEMADVMFLVERIDGT